MINRKSNLYSFGDGQMEDIMDLDGNYESSYQASLTNPIAPKPGVAPAQPPAGKYGATPAEQQMGANVGSAAGSIAGSVLQGTMQMADNDAARKEARGLAGEARKDQLKQENIEYNFHKRQQEQAERQLAIQKQVETYNTKFGIWQNTFKREMENWQGAMKSAETVLNEYEQSDEKTRQAMMKMFI
jgi:hypothetical protein